MTDEVKCRKCGKTATSVIEKDGEIIDVCEACLFG